MSAEPGTRAPAAAGRDMRLLLASLLPALFVMGLDTGVVNVIQPELQTFFRTTTSMAMMLATIYYTVMAAFQLVFGRVADLFNPLKTFLAGVICFFLGSLACALSQTITQLLIFRAAQAFGGAVLGSSFGAIVMRMMPKEKTGSIIGLLVMVLSLGGIVGPPLGGFLTERLSWHWAFVVNLPICALIAVPLIVLILPGQSRRSPRRRVTLKDLDPQGSVCSVFMFSSLPLALGLAARQGWLSGAVWALLGVFIVSGLLFVDGQRRAENPLLDISLLRDVRVAYIVVSKIFFLMVVNAVMLVYPFFMVKYLGLTVAQTGLTMLGCALSMAVLTPLSGKLTDRLGAWKVLALGNALLLPVGLGTLYVSARADAMSILLSLIFFGVCFAGLSISSTVYILQLAPKGQEGVFSGLNSLLMNVSGAIGLAFFSYVYAVRAATRDTVSEGAMAGFQACLVVVLLLAVLSSVLIGLARVRR